MGDPKKPSVDAGKQRSIGENLQNIRKKRGITQAALAKQLHITRAAVTLYETGRSHLTDSILIQLCSILQVSAGEILGLEKPSAPTLPRRWAKRLNIVEGLPDSIKKHILRALDDLIKANTRLSIFDDE
jgi:transcriptional regulator with XRE-family HTH domain